MGRDAILVLTGKKEGIISKWMHTVLFIPRRVYAYVECFLMCWHIWSTQSVPLAHMNVKYDLCWRMYCLLMAYWVWIRLKLLQVKSVYLWTHSKVLSEYSPCAQTSVSEGWRQTDSGRMWSISAQMRFSTVCVVLIVSCWDQTNSNHQ